MKITTTLELRMNTAQPLRYGTIVSTHEVLINLHYVDHFNVSVALIMIRAQNFLTTKPKAIHQP